MKIKSLYRLITLILFSSISLTGFAQSNVQIPLADFVSLPDARNVKISPDGKHLAVIINANGESAIAIFDRALKLINIFRVVNNRTDIGDYHWATNKRIIYTIVTHYTWDKTKFETGEINAVNIDDGITKQIFGYRTGQMQTGSLVKKRDAEYGSQEILDILPDDEDNILVAFYPWEDKGKYWRINEQAIPEVYKLNINNGKKQKVDSLPMPLSSALTDNDGNLRFSSGINEKGLVVTHYKKANAKEWMKFHFEEFSGVKVRPIGFALDNNHVYVTANVGSGTRALYEVDLNKGQYKKIHHNPKVDISVYVYGLNSKKVVAVGTDLGEPEYYYLDAKDKAAALHKSLRGAFKGHDVKITSVTKDNSFAVVLVSSDVNSGDYFLMDTKTFGAEFLFSSKEKLYPNEMAKMQPLTIKTRDNFEIHGYLTKPQGEQKGLVVFPHGGPHDIRDYWGFDWEVQLLASRGYAVLQVNYRGSGGFGNAFSSVGYREWGGMMMNDITDATKQMIKEGHAKTGKICIYGASFGGYAALMGAVREPDLYKCTIGSMGVYSLPLAHEIGDIVSRERGVLYRKRSLGEDPVQLQKFSPVYNVDKIKADILLIHGKRDRRVPIEHAEVMMAALEKVNKQYEWFEISDEGHGYYDPKSRLEVYQKILNFLDKNLSK
ncbi:MAG: S9 family peptidase [Gammaproteobacteria bacterium]|nr:S9 family peptidase [Gammaproteobacteria bacterium]MDH5629561.1 S9 family peptidase [Gammaproteobacteria bacterium]